jgi:hypothetical protein
LVRRTAIIGFLAAVLIGNLVLMLSQPRTTNALSDPTDKRPAADRLASRKVSNNLELTEAAAASGLRLSRHLVGIVDRLTRIDERDVTMAGWLADPYGDATPLNVLVFVAGEMVGTARTQGERPDVTENVGLGFGAEKNVSFRVRFGCRTGEQPMVAGLGPKERYVPMVSPSCP